MEKTTAVVLHAASLAADPTPGGAQITAAAADALEAAEAGAARDVVIGAVQERLHLLLTTDIEALSLHLSRETGRPAAALRTRTGLNAVLEADGHGKDALSRSASLPGTLLVLAVLDLERLVANRRTSSSSEFHRELNTVWEEAMPSGRGFDALIDAAGEDRAETARVGWALINLEGRRHVNLVWHQANKLRKTFPDRDAEELLTWGWLGLRTALRNYKPQLGFAFSTYACTRIVGAIRDGVRAENPVPKRLGTLARKVAQEEAELAHALGRAPTMQEISEALALETSTLQTLRRTRTPASIEEIVAGIDRNGGNEPEWLSDPVLTENHALDAVQAEQIAAAIQELPAEEAEAIRLLIFEDRSPTEARQIAGVTARQLRQRKERALSSLRGMLADLDPGQPLD